MAPPSGLNTGLLIPFHVERSPSFVVYQGGGDPMGVRHGNKAERPIWKHPEDVEGLPAVIGGSLSEPREAAIGEYMAPRRFAHRTLLHN
jgi:hypothetical protein